MTATEILTGPRVALVPLGPEHADALLAIRNQPEVLRWWRAPEPGFPLGDGDGSVRYAVLLRGRPTVRGLIQYAEEEDPDYRHASIDLFLDTAVAGHGYGREVVGVLARHLVRDRGHHRLTIDPATANAAAIACYRAAGFREVGVLRRYERGADGTWHDGLLMDALADDLVPPEVLAPDDGRLAPR